LVFLFLPISFFFMTDNFQFESFKPFFSHRIISSCFLICVFYTNLKILTPNILRKEKVVLSLLVLVLSLVLLIAVTRAFPPNTRPPQPPQLPELMQPSMTYMRPPLPPDRSGLPRLLGAILSYILVVGVSSGMAMQRDRQRQVKEKQQMALEKMVAELSVLKLQISPHFLFNTLNNIRWLARQKSDKTEDAIVKLSQLLRYILYQAQNEKVPLEQEINHLKNFIDLQKMRLTNPNCVTFTYEGALQGRMIEPLLFIPFVENAFKYGIHSLKPSDIVFDLHATDNALIFESRNTIFDDILPNEKESSGIGIANVQKRLALHYPNRHELRLDTEGCVFHVFLKLMD
jgi:uncharacterized membrane-anchored protein YhcB (DUF1043 family)